MRRLVGGLVLALLAACWPSAAVRAADDLCFPQTGRCIGGAIRAAWERDGGLAVFGLPINSARRELNRDTGQLYQTQWFERNRIELHPENAAPFDVLLGRLGAESIPADAPAPARQDEAGPAAGCRWFAETRRNLCDQAAGAGFKSYWESHGLEFDGRAGASYAESLALFGFPLTQPVVVANSSGDTVLTQWFERARFEWHPANPAPFKVLLGRLGAEVFQPAAATGAPRFHEVREPGWPFPLEVQDGLTIEEAYQGLWAPRFMAFDPADQSVLVANRDAGQVVRLFDGDGDGRFERQQVVADGLLVVHSLAVVDGAVFAAEENRLLRLADFDASGRARQVTPVIELPSGATDLYGHRTRTVLPGPDGYLYVSIGSSCDVCVETSPLRAAIVKLRPDGSDLQVVATGLRNTVGMAWEPLSGALWGADMGRNNLGADLPPDELNRIVPGKDYGWPYCYGAGQPDPAFNDPGRCAATVPPALDFPAHWAPLGLAFYDRIGLPPAFQFDALVAFHGTASQQVERISGFRVSRIRFEQGAPAGLEDVVRGWNQGQTV
ncbi:MAG TPA: PQQ-dependent sugar dehydrogenase, partial [Herpetosiphonaceae bacterium]